MLALPTIIQLSTSNDLNSLNFIGAVALTISSTILLITRPLSDLMALGTAGSVPAFQLFQQAMPTALPWFDVTYPQVGGIGAYMTNPAHVLFPPLLVIPVILLIWGAIRAGTYTTESESGVGVGLRFAAKLYFGGIVSYGFVWGILGAFAGAWTWPTIFIIIGNLIAASWIDMLFIFFMGAVLGAAGHVLGKKQEAKKAQKAEVVVQKEAQVSAVQAPLLAPAPRVAIAVPVAAAPEERYVISQFCEMCGTRLDPQGIYCPGCGARVRKEVPEVVAPTTIPARVQAVLGEETPATPALSPAEIRKQRKLQNLERAIVTINRYSAVWAVLFTVLSIVTGGITTGFTGNPYNVLAAVFLAPFGFFAAQKDQQFFQDKINNRNYASRGIDMLIVGAMGSSAGGAGFLIFIKGLLVLIYTQNNTEEFPKLNVEQWEARVYQEANVYAAPLVMLATIGLAADFAQLTIPTAWVIISILFGVAIYYVYVNYVKMDLVQGNFYNAERKCFILGIIGLIANAGGILILVQGIILHVHRTGKDKHASAAQSPVEEQEMT